MSIRCAVVGLGMGKGHAENFHNHPDSELAAVCDLDEKRLKEAADKWGCKTYTDLGKLLKAEKPDVVSIATPNKFHAPLTIQALQAGAHVLCEKPMAMTAPEAARMLAVAAKVDRRLMINFSYRFNPSSYALKKQVEAGRLGDIYAGRSVWHRRRGMPGFGGWFGQKALAGGGPLIDLGVHRLDLALWLMDYPEPEWVLANAYNPIATRIAAEQGKTYDVEDSAFAMIRFKGGQMLNLEASWALNQREREFMETKLYGTKGGLIQHNRGEGYDFHGAVFIEEDGVQYDLELHPPIPAAKNAYHHFVEAIRDGVPNMATAEEGITVMKLLDAIYASAAKGKPIKIG